MAEIPLERHVGLMVRETGDGRERKRREREREREKREERERGPK